MSGEKEGRYLGAREAAGELGISVQTLYAYVSRGLIRSEAVGGKKRNRRYRAEDVRRLRERKEQRRDPGKAAEGALYWGTPVMESAITLISDGKLYYRGRDALALAAGNSIEEVAALIWTGDPANASEVFGVGSPTFSPRYESVRKGVSGLPPVEAFQVLLPLAATEDLAAYDLRPAAVARTGARILRLMSGVAAGEEAAGGSVAATLRRGWAPRHTGAEALFGSALVLCADHELNVSTFAARCVASSEANPYAAVTAGLAALQGAKHGGQTELVEALLREVEASGDPRRVIAGRLKRGEGVPGFGHSLYPGGDPRSAELLRLAAEARPESPAVALSGTVAEEVLGLIDERPTLDFGLVTLAQTLGLSSGGAIALFAIGRTVGWVGHAIEQYGSDSLIRPRARYTGEPVG
ncbi:MAG: 2-methylcitrate synthase [uncultured Rubrobacteraceae bacterium]|uniref:citrate synthase (unknown stereospecificity) n=1 Tax=uncultured Rubrobacteraceae bacterium TaxID=349277 RepID=A0A6J4Q9N4_9ACTN|nr:MAG: 2-methylcitrate synthase [uncultured Rubrobacteraceae bacterium]